MNFSNLPALKLLIYVVIGIIIYHAIPQGNDLYLLVITTILLMSVLFKRQYGFAVAIMSITIGFLISFNFYFNKPETLTKNLPESKALFSGEVLKVINSNKKTTTVIAVGILNLKDLPAIDDSRILLRIWEFPTDINVGDNFFSSLNVHLPRPKQVPNEFDERSYAKSFNVEWIGRTYSNNIIITEKSSFNLYKTASILSNKIKTFHSQIYSTDVVGIVNALITGDKTNIDKEVRKNYSLSGTAHLLAISGLHMGIIALLVFTLLSGVSNRKLKFTIFTFSIISFVIISGMSASAVRAGVMIILFYIAIMYQRPTNVINIISFAVIIIILVSPNMIFSIGFQMSVVAVFGIVIYYKILRNKLNTVIRTKSMLLELLINSFLISAIASISLTMIIAYYFGTISVLSPIANLLAVPLMSFALMNAVFTIGVSFLSLDLSQVFAGACEASIKLVNWISDYTSDFEYSYINNEYVIPISIMIFIVFNYLLFSNSIKLFVFRIFISALCIFILSSIYEPQKQRVNTYIYDNLNVVEVNLDSNNTFIALIDKEDNNKFVIEYPVLEYLKNHKDSLILGYNGIHGLSLIDEVKKSKTIGIRNLNLDAIEQLAKELNIKEKLYKINKYAI